MKFGDLHFSRLLIAGQTLQVASIRICGHIFLQITFIREVVNIRVSRKFPGGVYVLNLIVSLV